MTLGVLDWGIGGLGLVRAMRDAGTQPPVLYVSDAGYRPYGTVEEAALRARVAEVTARMLERCDRVVVACNAASTVLPEDRRVVGVLEAGIRAALAVPGTLGVIGGGRTLASGVHATALRARGRRVHTAVAQPLSARVEAGELRGEATRADAVAVFDALGPVDAVLLACTHYPALLPLFRSLHPARTWIDPVQTLLAELSPPPGLGPVHVATTGDPDATRMAASRAWGLAFDRVHPW